MIMILNTTFMYATEYGVKDKFALFQYTRWSLYTATHHNKMRILDSFVPLVELTGFFVFVIYYEVRIMVGLSASNITID